MRGRLFGAIQPGRALQERNRGRGRPTGREIRLERLEERQLLASFLVTSTGDSGIGSLRQAILDANQNSGADEIDFEIAGGGIQTIALLSPLPSITEALTIAGETQDPTALSPVIEIDGSGAGTSTGLRISADNVTIRRLSIINFDGHGILVEANSATIVGCYIGVGANGSALGGNTGSGVFLSNSSNSLIGIPGTTLRNVISGNTGAGVTIDGSTSTNVLVARSLIGVGANGSLPLPNAVGVEITGGASFNVIGSVLQGEANVISGNAGAGVHIADASARGNVVIGNAIGTNANGTLPAPNQGVGISVTDAQQTQIGGINAGEGNIICTNVGDGIDISNALSTLVQGNRIGTNQSGDTDLGNGGAGVLVRGGSTRTLIGGLDDTAGNVIAYNGKINQAGGIVVLGATTLQNQILSNSLYLNNGLGIDLAGNGVTNNDNGDGDTGPNGLQNYPVITNAATGAGRTLVQGNFNSTPNSSFLVQFFASDSRDPTQFGEGKTLVGTVTITTNASGNATFNQTLSTPTVVGNFLSATATSLPLATGNTSEFSRAPAITLARVADLILTMTGTPDPAMTGSTLTYNVSVTNQGPDSATNVQFSQLLSSTVTLVSATSSQGSVAGTSSGVSGTLGTIASGQTVTVTVQVTPNQVGVISSNAQVFSSEIDPNSNNNGANVSTVITNPGNLTVTAGPEVNPVTLSQNLTFQVLVANNGNFLATNVRVTSTIPANANLIGVFTGQGSVSVIGNQITANLESIAVGSAVAVRVILSPSIAGTYQETFTATSDQIDTFPSDNTATATANVLPNADLGVSVIASSPSVILGQVITYTATVTNNGPSPATNVKLNGTLPTGLNPIASPGIVINGNNVSANLGNLAVGDSVVVVVSATPSGSVSGVLNSVFTFPSVRDQGDLTPGNDSATVSTAVQTVDLEVAQSLFPVVPILGSELAYSVLVHNNGPADATGVVVKDTLPTGAVYVAGSASLTGINGTVVVANGALTATFTDALGSGSTAMITFSVVPQQPVVLVNQATIQSLDQFDTNLSNNTSTNSSAVSPADLAVIGSGPVGPVFVGNTATINLSVTNNGPAPATGTVLTMLLPTGISFDSATTTQGSTSFLNDVVIVTIGSIAVGAPAVQVQVKLHGTTAANYSLGAAVVSAELDNNSANDTATINLQVINAPGSLQFSTAVYQQPENAGQAVVTITRTGGTQGIVSVNYQTQDGTAHSGVNYQGVSGVATFLDGQTTFQLSIPLLDDSVVTNTLTVGLVLSNPTGGASLGANSTATLNILNTTADTIAPTVTSIILIGPGTTIGALAVQFSEAVDAASANNAFNYVLLAPGGQQVAIFQPSYNADLHQVFITPASPLVGGKFYTLVINGASPGGVTDLAGNFLDGADTGDAGTNFVNSFGRGSSLTYIDADGDKVNLRLQNAGILEVFRSANGNAQLVRLLGTTRRTILSGSVQRTRLGGNGQTNLGVIQGADFGKIKSRLRTPPFHVNSQSSSLVPPVQISSIKKLTAARKRG